jgi:hypothetical protein
VSIWCDEPTDRDGQRVDARCLDVGRGLHRIGSRPVGVDAVLAADFAELGLDRYARAVTGADDRCGRRDVLFVGEIGGIEHHRSEAEVHGLGHELGVGGVVEMHRDGNTSRARHRQGRCANCA